jgi:hypothetical protein
LGFLDCSVEHPALMRQASSSWNEPRRKNVRFRMAEVVVVADAFVSQIDRSYIRGPLEMRRGEGCEMDG